MLGQWFHICHSQNEWGCLIQVLLKNQVILLLLLEIAIKIIPIARAAIADAGFSLSSPDERAHIAMAMLIVPIISPSFTMFTSQNIIKCFGVAKQS